MVYADLCLGLQVECEAYWSSEQIASSDHKPVAALLQLQQHPIRPHWWPTFDKTFNKYMVSERMSHEVRLKKHTKHVRP